MNLKQLFRQVKNPKRTFERRRFQPCVATDGLERRDLMASLVPGGIVSSNIGASNEVDTWTYSISSSQTIELITTSTPSQAGFIAYAELFSPAGVLIQGFWPGANIQRNLTEIGTYTIKIRDDNYRETGSYAIGLETLKPASPSPGSLVKGGIVSGSISTPIEKDQWTFSMNQGDSIELISTSTSSQSGFNAYAEVYSPAGELVNELTFFAGNNKRFTARESGTYVLQIRDDNWRETGNYTIGLETLKPASPSPGSLVKGGIVSGSISTPIEKDQWTFSMNQGDSIELITTSSSSQSGFNAYADVFSPAGELVNELTFFAGNNRRFTARDSGTYVLQIRDDNWRETGNYTIGLETLKPASPDAKTLTSGSEVTGSINTAIQKDQWIINIPRGKKLKVTLSGKARDAGYQVFMEVFSPAGELLDSMFGGTKTFSFNRSGKLILQVRDVSLSKRGSYKMTASAV